MRVLSLVLLFGLGAAAHAQDGYVRAEGEGLFRVQRDGFRSWSDDEAGRRTVERGDRVRVLRAEVRLCIKGQRCGRPIAPGEEIVVERSSRSLRAQAGDYVGGLLALLGGRLRGPRRSMEPMASDMRTTVFADSLVARAGEDPALDPVLLFPEQGEAFVKPGAFELAWLAAEPLDPRAPSWAATDVTLRREHDGRREVVARHVARRPGTWKTPLVLLAGDRARYCVELTSVYGHASSCFRVAAADETRRLQDAMDALESDLGAGARTSLEAVGVLVATGFWYDAFLLLAELLRESPRDPDLLQVWDGLLSVSGVLGSP